MAEVYNAGLQRFLESGVAWTSADIRMLLLKSTGPPTFDATHGTITAVLAHANNTECSDGSYARVAIPGGGNRTIEVNTRKRQAHIGAAVDFGALTNETVGAAVVFIHITDDDGSIPLAFLTSNDFPLTANGAGFTISQGAAGLFEVEGVAGA